MAIETMELGLWEEDPRMVENAAALRKLATYGELDKAPDTEGHQTKVWLEYDEYDDPRVLATQAAVRDARTYEEYKQTGAWVLEAGVEVSPESNQ